MKKIITVLITTALLSGCASIIKGRNQTINVMTANGDNVQATVFSKNGMLETELPRVISVSRDSQDITIRVKDDKCHTETVAIAQSRVEPWFWGNILSGRILGSSTDYATGAMWKYDSNVNVNVTKKSQCSK